MLSSNFSSLYLMMSFRSSFTSQSKFKSLEQTQGHIKVSMSGLTFLLSSSHQHFPFYSFLSCFHTFLPLSKWSLYCHGNTFLPFSPGKFLLVFQVIVSSPLWESHSWVSLTETFLLHFYCKETCFHYYYNPIVYTYIFSPARSSLRALY